MIFGFVCCYSINHEFVNIYECCKVLQVLTALGNGSGGGEVSVLAVHVVGATAGVIAQPDAKVFHFQRGFLMNLWRKKARQS